jgi:hypothetical protein
MNGMVHHGLKLINIFHLKLKILTLLLPILVSCQHTNNAKHDGKNKEIICSDSLKFVTLISSTLELPNLQQYFKVQETLNQKELVVLNNKRFIGVDKLNKFNKPIKLMSETEIGEKDIKAYIDYKEINIKNDTAYVYYRYDVQGIGIKSTYFFKNCQWQLINSHLWEN